MILIVQSLWNQSITDKIVEGALERLQKESPEPRVRVYQVPGALEIPLAIQWAFDRGEQVGESLTGVIAAAAVVKGETYHFDLVANDSSRALMDLSLKLKLPVANAILAVYDLDQALQRIGGKHGHKGVEAAEAVLTMIELRRRMELL